jgi:stage V sporulation protein AD
MALSKGNISHKDINFLIAGDLQNQCVATSFGLSSFNIPYLGVYGACSTCTETLLLSSALLDGGDFDYAASVTSSHNSTAERQFRTPIEYGGQRTGTAQWTATAAGAFILTREKRSAKITEYMIGKIISGETSDGSNMGGAMAFAAADTILSYFKESGASPSDFDYIVTGDLGKVGSKILREILEKEGSGLEKLHTDCGLLLYDEKKQDIHSGASGCGTSASVLAAHFLPMLESGKLRRILFLSTGALMNPSILLQGESILGIAPLIKIEGESRNSNP